MDKKLETYYENRFDLTSQKGWNDLIEDVKIMYDSYSDIRSISSDTELYFRKGQLDILDWILSLRMVSEASYKQLKEEDDSSL